MGHLQRLDAKTGESIWQKNLCDVANRKPPMWGYCSSPLVVGSTLIVHAGGSGDKGTLGFDTNDGSLRWSAASGKQAYSSPQLCKVANEMYLLMMSERGLELLDPKTGEVRLEYDWKHSGYRALQPHVVDGNTILLPTGLGAGTRRIRIIKNADALSAEEMWTSRNLKPDFNDLVVHEGFAYGFDGTIFTCIDLDNNGEKQWKKGRYGKGQVLLLGNSDVLFVITEKGQGILVKADPGAHTELAKLPMLNDKTWNHPVVVGDRLYGRNAREAACYKLALIDSNQND
jgi:outer membrane protein assembly factor BamB